MDKPKPIKIVNRVFDRLAGYQYYADGIYDIRDYRGLEIDPQTPNENGVLPPVLWFCFRNTKSELFLINVSRTPNGKYIFGYKTCHGAYGGGSSCFPSEKWRFNKPYTTDLKQCLINAMKYIINHDFSFGDEDRKLRETAADALKDLRRPEIRQLTIFDILDGD